MRFTIFELLALTLLTSLALAIYVKQREISATTVGLATLQAANQQGAEDCQEQERQISSLTRAINRRATDLKILSGTVDQAADSLNQAAVSLVVPTPRESTVSRKIIPTWSREGQIRERTKIHVPANLVCELQLKFIDDDGNPEFFEDFEEPRRHSIPLAFGDNFIEVAFDWNRVPNIFTLTNHTNSVSIHVPAKDVRGKGWSPALGQGFYKTGSFSSQRGMTLFEGGLGFKKGTRVLVQMVESKKQ